MEYIGRAETLAAMMVVYAWQATEFSNAEALSPIHQAVDLLEDLGHLAYGPLMDLPDEEDLVRKGWQPPPGPAGHAKEGHNCNGH
jgi:hypothetical protein